jgi:uncharacterized protein YqgC (DUF456 family)
MVDLLTIAAFGILLLGVLGSVIPQVPGPLLSIGGLGLYWWGHNGRLGGTAQAALAGLLLVGLLAVVVDLVAGPIAAKVGGASWTSTVVASLVGLFGLVLAGPLVAIGLLLVTVLVLELHRHDDPTAGLKTAAVTAIGILGSAVVQTLLTASILIGVALVAVL